MLKVIRMEDDAQKEYLRQKYHTIVNIETKTEAINSP